MGPAEPLRSLASDRRRLRREVGDGPGPMKDGREERLDASALLSLQHRNPLSVDAISRFAEVEGENFCASAARCGLANSAGRSQQDPYQAARCAGV